MVIRPKWARGDNGHRALEIARTKVGGKYDFTGTIGLDIPERYYCSELAVEIYKTWQRPEDHLPNIIEPGQLYLWGRVLYDSFERD